MPRLGGAIPPAPPITAPPRRRRVTRRLCRWCSICLAVATFVEACLGASVWVGYRDGPVGSTRFIQADQRRAGDPDTPDSLKRALARPAQEWVARENVSRAALTVLLGREDPNLSVRQLPFSISDFWDRARAWTFGGGGSDPSGSTIPQQVAKNLFTNGERSALRKAIEANFSLLLRPELSRRRVFEIYLNIVEFGPGIYGICAASWFYFDKAPMFLDHREMATLAALMPSPKRYTIYPASPPVQFAQDNVNRYVFNLYYGLPPNAVRNLVDVRPDRAKPGCLSLPASLQIRLAATSTPDGYPRERDDQWYWARLVRQYAHGNLPGSAELPPAVRNELRRRVRWTPGARP